MDDDKRVEHGLTPSAPQEHDSLQLPELILPPYLHGTYDESHDYVRGQLPVMEEVMQYHKDWKNNKNYRRNSVNQGCLWAIVSLWATVDVAIGSTKVALGAWIVTHIEGTTNIALGLMALGSSWILRSLFLMMAICSKNSKWFFGFYLLLGPSFLILPPSLLWFHLLETVICLHKIMHRSNRLCYPEELSNQIVSIPDDSYNTSHGYGI